MAEVAFARVFLAALDNRSVKLPNDYMEDAKNLPPRPPYILPRMPKKMQRAVATTAAGTDAAAASSCTAAPGTSSTPSVAIAVKSMHRNPPLDVRLPGVYPLNATSLLEVRTALAAQTGVPVDKLKLLYNKKPVADSKVLKDLVGAGGGGDGSVLELSVMVSGGAATVAAAEAVAAEAAVAAAAKAAAAAPEAPAPTPSTAGAPADSPGSTVSPLEGEAFWNDLQKFLAQRIPNPKQADEAFSLFLRAWEDRMA